MFSGLNKFFSRTYLLSVEKYPIFTVDLCGMGSNLAMPHCHFLYSLLLNHTEKNYTEKSSLLGIALEADVGQGTENNSVTHQ